MSKENKITLTNTDKILFPESKITKGDIIDYYGKIAPIMLPLIKDRPLTLVRYPATIEKGFFQKDRSDFFPPWIKSVPIEKENGDYIDMVVAHKKESLQYLANLGAIVLHPWLSRCTHIRQPDKIIFDLDPSENNFSLAILAAKDLRNCLSAAGFMPFVMTSGSKGLHVIINIRIKYTFEEIKAYARKLSEQLAQTFPEKYTTEIRKDKRHGRLFIDFLRNAYAQTAVAPYSVRAIESAPVATPLNWDELDDKNLTAQSFNIFNIFDRIEKSKEAWKNFNRSARSVKL